MGNDMFNEEQLAFCEERGRIASAAHVAEREIAQAHGLLTCFGIPEQMPPFKTPLAPLAFRLHRLNALREQEIYVAAKAEQRHAYDKGKLEAKINQLLWRVGWLTVALRPLAALAPAYAELGLDGAAILTVQVPDSDSPRNVQLLPAHAIAAAAALAEEPREVPA